MIGHAKEGRLHIKASDVDRRLSLKLLTDTLGAFEPAGLTAGAEQAGASYTRGALYEAYMERRAIIAGPTCMCGHRVIAARA